MGGACNIFVYVWALICKTTVITVTINTLTYRTLAAYCIAIDTQLTQQCHY